MIASDEDGEAAEARPTQELCSQLHAELDGFARGALKEELEHLMQALRQGIREDLAQLLRECHAREAEVVATDREIGITIPRSEEQQEGNDQAASEFQALTGTTVGESRQGDNGHARGSDACCKSGAKDDVLNQSKPQARCVIGGHAEAVVAAPEIALRGSADMTKAQTHVWIFHHARTPLASRLLKEEEEKKRAREARAAALSRAKTKNVSKPLCFDGTVMPANTSQVVPWDADPIDAQPSLAVGKHPTQDAQPQGKQSGETRAISLGRVRLGTQRWRNNKVSRMVRLSQWQRKGEFINNSRIKAQLEGIVYSTQFEYLFFGLIILNSIAIGFQTDYLARRVEPTGPPIFTVIELSLCAIFTLEVGARLYTNPTRYLHGPGRELNIIDLGVAAAQTLGIILDALANSVGANFYLLRIVRLIRLVRIVRTVRLLKFVGEVRAIIWSVGASFKPLCGAMLIIFMLVYIFGVYFTEVVLLHRAKVGKGHVSYDALGAYFGTLDVCIYSLFQAISGGIDWGDLARPLIDHISPWFGLVISLFVAFSIFALMNVLTGIFVEQALRRNGEDRDNYIVSYIKRVFASIALGPDDVITQKDFLTHLDSKEMRELFKSIDLDVSEADGVFRILDLNDDGALKQDEFLNGCLRLRGPAKALDLLVLMRETNRMFNSSLGKLDQILTQVAQIDSRLRKMPSNLGV